MIYKQNLHTHSRYCDGVDGLEDIVKKAIELKFDSIGFSGHCYLDFFPTGGCMSLSTTEKYKKEINQLKVKYKDKIDIYCGIEFDKDANVDLSGFDYVIGSVHFVRANGMYLGVDYSLERAKKIISDHFGGDSLKYAKAYYESVAELPKRAKFDIVGHFDLLTKFSEKEDIIDLQSPLYRDYALDALYAISKHCKVFEVNTGAISRGVRTTPYPAPFILKEIKKLGCKVILSSDCHNKNYLDCNFNESLEYIKSCGFDEILYFKNGNFIGQKI